MHWQWSHDGVTWKTRVWTGAASTGPLWLGLHGFTGSGADFAPWFTEFSGSVRWEAPDLPGHGCFDGKTAASLATMEACRAMLRARVESADVPVVVVGYSLGGRVALNFAAQFSHLIDGLVLIGANPGIRDEELRAQRLAWEDELCLRLRRDGLAGFLRYWQSLPIIATQSCIPEPIWALMQERRLQGSADGLEQSIRGMGTGNMVSIWDELGNIECPVLYCAGQEDLKYCRVGQEVASSVPHGQFVAVPGAGHAAHLEEMVSSGEIVSRWYRSVSD